MQYQTLKLDRILVTQRRLLERIDKRFPDSGLAEVAEEFSAIAEHAGATAEEIRKPNMPVRIVVGLLLAAGVALGLWVLFRPTDNVPDSVKEMSLFQLAELGLRGAFFLGAAIVFLLSIEVRLKRRRALNALHKLRAVAHVIDMHQMGKNPERLMEKLAAGADPGATQTTKDPADLHRYLTYCIELLAMVSKLAALYAQDVPDGPITAAVDQVENLCGALSQKMFQKSMLLDRLTDEASLGRRTEEAKT